MITFSQQTISMQVKIWSQHGKVSAALVAPISLQKTPSWLAWLFKTYFSILSEWFHQDSHLQGYTRTPYVVNTQAHPLSLPLQLFICPRDTRTTTVQMSEPDRGIFYQSTPQKQTAKVCMTSVAYTHKHTHTHIPQRRLVHVVCVHSVGRVSPHPPTSIPHNYWIQQNCMSCFCMPMFFDVLMFIL